MTRRGFTLVEVLVALSVFCVGILGVAEITTRSQRLSALTITRTRAALLAQEGIERAEAVSYDELTPGNFLDEPSLAGLGEDYAPFVRQVVVQYVDGSLNSTAQDLGLKLITSTVSWTSAAHDVSNLPREYSIRTIRTNL